MLLDAIRRLMCRRLEFWFVMVVEVVVGLGLVGSLYFIYLFVLDFFFFVALICMYSGKV